MRIKFGHRVCEYTVNQTRSTTPLAVFPGPLSRKRFLPLSTLSFIGVAYIYCTFLHHFRVTHSLYDRLKNSSLLKPKPTPHPSEILPP